MTLGECKEVLLKMRVDTKKELGFALTEEEQDFIERQNLKQSRLVAKRWTKRMKEG